MQKIAMKIAALFCGVVLVISSCQREADPTTGSPTPTTVAEDKAFLNSAVTNTLNCVRNVRDGESVQALLRFLALSNGTVGNETWINTMSDELNLKMGDIELDPNNSKFYFQNHWGTYNWDRITQTFTKTAATGIFINFPSEPTQLTNNVSISFDTYLDALYQANAENIYLPTRVKMKMVKDNVEIVNVDYTGTFSSGNFPSPISVTYTSLVKPQQYKITVTRLTNVQFTVKVELFGTNGCVNVIDTKTTFLNDDYNNLDIEEDLSTIEATYTSGALKIKGNWNARMYYQFTNPTTAQKNSTFTCEVFNNDQKIGDLRLKDVNGSEEVFIYYKDSSNENAEVYSTRFTNDLKEILRPYFGNDVDTWF